MNSLVEIGGWCVAGLLAVPFVTLTVETLAALLPARRIQASTRRPRLAVLVPAHDEEAGIAATLERIRPQLAAGDRLVVVADNCTDGTAAAARTAGAEVVERHDSSRRGKGFALDHGLKFLAADPPNVLIVFDADTEICAGTVDALARAVAARGRPVQGVNLLHAPDGAGPAGRISAFAFLLKNMIRPRGLDRLGLHGLLYGTGMALPWAGLQTVDLAHGDITEDIRLGVELALNGYPPAFCGNAEVRGEFPRDQAVAATQRRRWEHGHMSTLTRQVPRLLAAGLFSGRPKLLALAVHLGVPPLALLFTVGGAAIALLCVMRHWPAVFALGAVMGLTVVAILLAWARFGRAGLPARDLLLMPYYVVRKIPLYFAFLFRPQREWVRTKRGDT